MASYLENLCQAEAFLARPQSRSLVHARREDLEAFLADLLLRRAPETVATCYRRLWVLYRWLAGSVNKQSGPRLCVEYSCCPCSTTGRRSRTLTGPLVACHESYPEWPPSRSGAGRTATAPLLS
jgi:hypothetical protein